jgi:Rrf2 family protein
MFSQTVEYALRAVVCLAQADEALTTAEISTQTKVPPSYLSKVLQSLVRAQLISATRGIYGGYSLAVPAQQLCLLSVVNAIEPLKRIHSCPLDIPSHGAQLCPLHKRMDRVVQETEHAFSNTTIAELLADDTGSTPLCAGKERSRT